MKEFRSKLEDLISAEELFFPPTPGFGELYDSYLEHAKAHPAKMNTWLLEWLIKAFTKPGDTVLDPMAGSGSTGVIAALHGRNAVQVELEKKFYGWMEKARENVESNSAIPQKGWIKNILGDARCLSQLLQDADICITSPPYAETYTGGGDPEKRRQRLIKAGHDPKDFLGGTARNAVLKHYTEVDTVVTSPPYGETISKRAGGSKGLAPYKAFVRNVSMHDARQYSDSELNVGNLPLGRIDAVITSPPYERQHQGGCDSPKVSHGCVKERYPSGNNIGNLPLGSVDTIITSPPYADVAKSKEGAISPHMQGLISKLSGIPVKEFAHNVERFKQAVKIAESKIPFKYSDNPENIGNLPFVDTVITSPPYQNALHDSMEERETWESKKIYEAKKGLPVGYSPNKDNIGNIKEHGLIDVVLTSPPYEGSLEGTTRHTRGGIASRDPALAQTGFYAAACCSPSQENIGSLKSSNAEYESLLRGLMRNGKPTYLSEMFKVYCEMWKVLKHGGLAIIVVKPFIRRKKVVDLPLHTWLLMARVGFRLAGLFKLRLHQMSFWRVLYYEKHPHVPLIAHEYVLVCQKTLEFEPSTVKPQVSPLDFMVEIASREYALQLLRKIRI